MNAESNTAPQSVSSKSTRGFASLSVLQAEHAALVKSVGKDLLAATNHEPIKKFVIRSVATGKVLVSTVDRTTAQGIITIWTTRLSTALNAKERAERAANGAQQKSASDAGPYDSSQSLKRLTILDEIGDSLLADFSPEALATNVIIPADAWLDSRPSTDQTLARRMILRLFTLKDDDQFDVNSGESGICKDLMPTDRPELVMAEAKLVLAELIRLGVVRTVRTPGSPEEYALHSRELLEQWPRLQIWTEQRKAIRQKAKDWAAQRDKTAEAPIAPSRWKKIGTSLREAGRRIGAKLVLGYDKLFKRIEGEQYLSKEEYDEAESYRDKSTEEFRLVYQKREADLERLEKRKFRFVVATATATGFAVIAAIAVWGWWRASEEGELAKAEKNNANAQKKLAETAEEKAIQERDIALNGISVAKAVTRVTDDLDTAQKSRSDLLKAIPMVESNPRASAQLAQKSYDDSHGVVLPEWPKNTKGEVINDKTFNKRYGDLEKILENTQKESLDCINQSLQFDYPRVLIGSNANTYDVNGAAVSRDGQWLASACTPKDGSASSIRLWKRAGDKWEPGPIYEILGRNGINPEAVKVAFGGPEGKWLAAACSEAGVLVWTDLEKLSQPPSFSTGDAQNDRGCWTRVAWSNSAPWLLAAAAESDSDDKLPRVGCLVCWEFDPQKPTKPRENKFPKPIEEEISAIAFGLDPKSEDATLYSAQKRDGKLLYRRYQSGTWAAPNPFPLHAGVAKASWNGLATGTLRSMSLEQSANTNGDRLPVLIGANEYGGVAIWEIVSGGMGKALFNIPTTSAVRGVAIDPEGHCIAAACRDSDVRLWRINSANVTDFNTAKDTKIGNSGGMEFALLIDHISKLTDVAFGRDWKAKRAETFLVSTGDEPLVRCWSVERRTGPVLRRGLSALKGFSFSPNLDAIAAYEPCCLGGGAKPMFLPLQADDVHRFQHLGNSARRIAYGSNSDQLATLDEDGVMRVWRSGVREPLEFKVGEDIPREKLDEILDSPIYGQIVFSPSGEFIGVSLTKGDISIFRIPPVGSKAGMILVDRCDKKQFQTLYGDDLQKNIPGEKKNSNAIDPAVYDFAFDKSGTRIALACSKGRLILADVKKGGLSAAKVVVIDTGGKNDPPSVNCLAFNEQGGRLAIGCSNGSIRLLDISLISPKEICSTNTEKESENHSGEVRRIRFRNTGDEIVSGGDDRNVIQWKIRTDALGSRLEFQSRIDVGGAVKTLAYSRDGNKLGVATANGLVRVYWLDPKELLEQARKRLGK